MKIDFRAITPYSLFIAIGIRYTFPMPDKKQDAYTRAFWLDMETTGLNPRNNFAFQISYIITEEGSPLVSRTLELCPAEAQNFRFDAAAQRVHGYSKQAILGLPPESAQFAVLIDDLNRHAKDKLTIAGYAVSFDCGFLKALFARNSHPAAQSAGFYAYFHHMPCDVLQLLQNHRIAGRLNLPNLRLETVSARFNLPAQNLHNSMADIENTKQIFDKVMAASSL